MAHRSALKAYVFFLYWAAQQCEAETSDGGGPAAAAAGAVAGRSPRPLPLNITLPAAAALTPSHREAPEAHYSVDVWSVTAPPLPGHGLPNSYFIVAVRGTDAQHSGSASGGAAGAARRRRRGRRRWWRGSGHRSGCAWQRR